MISSRTSRGPASLPRLSWVSRPRVWLLLVLTAPLDASGDVPTPEQACGQRNAALCRVGDVEFRVQGACGPGATTVKSAGGEPCDSTAVRMNRREPSGTVPAVRSRERPYEAMPVVSPGSLPKSKSLWLVVLVGFLLGLPGHRRILMFAIAGGAFPSVAAWMLVGSPSATTWPAGQILAYLALAYIWMTMFSIPGWAAGCVVRVLLFRGRRYHKGEAGR